MNKFEALAEKFEMIANRWPPAELAQFMAELCRLLPTLAERDQVSGAPEAVTMQCDFSHLPSRGGIGANPIRRVLYCYASQRRAVEALLQRPMGMHLRPLHDHHAMRGLDGGTFVHVTSHPQQVPDEIWHLIGERGWLVLRIDDTYARARAARAQR
jgi:hypothetical protein